jgi:hypothetical protein
VAKQDPNTKLCGSGLKDETTVLRWASFTNYELLPPIMAWIQPVIGRAPSSPEILAKMEEGCELTVRAIEKEIKGKHFLVGDTLTLADLFVVSGLARGYQYVSLSGLTHSRWVTNMQPRSSPRAGRKSTLLSTNTTCASETTRMESLIAFWDQTLSAMSPVALTLTTMVYEHCLDEIRMRHEPPMHVHI